MCGKKNSQNFSSEGAKNYFDWLNTKEEQKNTFILFGLLGYFRITGEQLQVDSNV